MIQLLPPDRFTLLDKIGQGGYGKVYAAVDTVASELVAIKTQRKDSSEATRELEAYFALPTHANVLHLHGFFLSTANGTEHMNIVFKHHNSSLHHLWVAAQGFLPMDHAWRYSHHLFSGLQHMHSHGICHRDITMPNLLVSFSDNVIQIADLGLSACAASFTLERNVTQITGRAPEILALHNFPSALTARQGSMDIWGAGVICGALHFACHLFWKPEDKALQILQAMIDFLGPPQD